MTSHIGLDKGPILVFHLTVKGRERLKEVLQFTFAESAEQSKKITGNQRRAQALKRLIPAGVQKSLDYGLDEEPIGRNITFFRCKTVQDLHRHFKASTHSRPTVVATILPSS
jgi:hypothetical protein